ncbi:MAG: xanthine dehydrogenase family protein [Acidimicrobiales bacterium]|nr:xanthine dehydrogenase family protein molybdopterin-binding subunit [Acidimicrobiaceae bacterium]MXV88438.1 xanthine dehydrogenase family protein [Acidimicrobiales bacterium]MXX43533.1 xanthine dehydrogenase family protein [Acidimicrobiales bacterium]MXY03979.1 xanthine dehydrogenase family protein [Acidimicrobiales bacterium]MYB82918.1 xanthine dehydrogenase family protein [Acidimicrobiales bacterium]
MSALGTSPERSDADAKLRGQAVFGADLSKTGMLWAALARSPVAAGHLRAIDPVPALRIDGVLEVVTAADVPDWRTGVIVSDTPMLAADYVAYEGEPVAIVVAESRAAAEAGARSVAVDIEPVEPVSTPEQALAPGARLVHPEWNRFAVAGGADIGRNGNVVAEVVHDPGDLDEAFAAADFVVEGTYRTPRQYQAHLEPKMALATYESGRYTIEVSHQYPFRLRDRVAQILGVAPSAVRVVGHHIGGGFGAKLDVSLEAFAALLAQRYRRPVRMQHTALEERLAAPCRANAITAVRSAVRRDGTILATDVEIVSDSGAYANNGPALSSIPMFVFGSIYRVGTARIWTRNVYTNTAPTGAYRGVNGPWLVFANERHMDAIADALGRDRREFRLASLARDGDLMRNGQPLEQVSILREAFDHVDDLSGWQDAGAGELRGVGQAAAIWLTNPMPGHATVKLNEDGTATVITSATENGSGAVATGLRQIAAEALGLATDQVTVTMPDTDATGYDAGSQGSRTTHVVGRAIADASAEVRSQVLDRASQMLEAAPEDLVITDGVVSVAGVPTASVTLGQVAQSVTWTEGPIAAGASYVTPTPPHDPLCATGMLIKGWPTPTYHLHQAEVSVDAVTGQVTVDRYIVCQEVGRAVHPDAITGQIQGGVAQGLGFALSERVDLDHGRYVQRTFKQHGLPLAADVPRVEAIVMEHADPAGPFGAKGAAEPPVVPVAAAVANAVAHAIGAPVDVLPITPEAVLDALERAQ